MTLSSFLTVAECAQYLRCSVEHIRDLCQQGKIEGFRDGRRIIVAAESVRAYLENRRLAPVSHSDLHKQDTPGA